MAQETYPLINGEYVSWVNLRIALDIHESIVFHTKDFNALDFGDKLEPGMVKGTGPVAVGRTIGEYSTEASMKMYAGRALAFMRELAKRKAKIGLTQFDLHAAWEPLVSGSIVDKVLMAGQRVNCILEGCRLTERKFSGASGSSDATVTDMPLSFMRLKVDGIYLI